ncbi:MAG: HAD-IA family hydrolase [Propionibacteriaceae bacterium]|jgi:putative hydrolase of the HAD superfamily|nr:HAD-IA family hydrolase [Propionibacteriaceae bacterium]
MNTLNLAPTTVFDLGHVLAEPANLYEPLADLLGVPAAQLQDVYYIHRHQYDMGLPDRDYWSRTVEELGVAVDLPALLDRLVAADVAGWSVIRPGAAGILEELGARGVPVAILSNAPCCFVQAFQHLPWRTLARQAFFSASLGLAKPDPAIYRHVEVALGADPRSLWFVDDRPENVAAAAERGWQAHQWRGDADTRAWLAGAGIL